MKVKNVRIKNFKRFTDLTIEDIPETAKMVVLVGQNGSGKTSVFEAFNYRYSYHNQTLRDDMSYHKQYADLSYHLNNRNIFIEGESYFGKLIRPDDCSGKLADEYPFVPSFRTSYRGQSIIDNDNIAINARDYEEPSAQKLVYNDSQVIVNYKVLILRIVDDILEGKNDTKTVAELREHYVNKLRSAVDAVFDNMSFNQISPLVYDDSSFNNSMFIFDKGDVSAPIDYNDLSSGEKAAFDLLLDIIVNQDVYGDGTLFIDEPEAHIHTKLQGKLIEEIYNLFPDEGQLWITTHSLGVMTKAKELSLKHPGSVVFLDFDGHDFDQPVTITPSPINRIIWQKFMSVALDGLEEKLAPEIIVLCEGSLEGKKRFNFDADIYTSVFQENYPNITFISGGSSNDLLQETKEFKMLSSVLDQKSKVIRLVDRDDHSDKDVIELEQQEIFTTSRRHIESYLFDDELIRKLVIQENKQELVDQALEIKQKALQNSINRGNAPDDIKSAAGEIFTELKKLLGLTRCGNKTEAFMKNTMLPLIRPETKVYKEMEREIIQPILKASKKNRIKAN